MQVMVVATEALVEQAAVIAEVAAEQADMLVQVAMVVMVLAFHMVELRGRVEQVAGVVLQLSACQLVQVEELAFKAKVEMAVPDRKGQILQAAEAEVEALVAAMVWAETAVLADQ